MNPTEKIASLVIERKALADINRPHPKNPRIIPADDSAEIATLDASLAHDYFDPIIWNKQNGLLVSGHVRTPRMIALGYTHADVVVVDYDEPTHEARMIAANNHSGSNSDDPLARLLDSLKKNAADKLQLTGMKPKDISRFSRIKKSVKLATDLPSEKENTEPDEAAPAPVAPPKPAAAPARYLIGFPINLLEKQEWDALKVRLKLTDDKAAWLHLIKSHAS